MSRSYFRTNIWDVRSCYRKYWKIQFVTGTNLKTIGKLETGFGRFSDNWKPWSPSWSQYKAVIFEKRNEMGKEDKKKVDR